MKATVEFLTQHFLDGSKRRDILRIELRHKEGVIANISACSRAEIEITKIIQGVACLCWPDGATLGRRRCTEEDKQQIVELLRGAGWDVTVIE